MRTTWNMTRKELRASANGATVYIVAVVFLLLWEYLFFRNVFLVGEASLRGLFDLLPWLLLILVPALTMGAISQERRDGTLELVLTHPVRDRDLLLGKFLAALGTILVLLLFTIPIALSIDANGQLDWGQYVGQLLAATCLAAALVSLGIFVSAVLESQAAALLVTAAASFLLVVVGDDLVAGRLPLSLASLLDQLSVTSHYRSMARGVVDLRDVWYFASVIAIFLASTMLMLLRRRYGSRRSAWRRWQVGIGMLVVIAVLVAIVGSRIPARVDLTRDGRYSVSDATRDTLRDLDDVARVTLYASRELPAQLQPVLRDATDLLRDYDSIGGRDLVVRIERPGGTKSKLAEQARSRGVQEVQFNVVGNEELALRQGFLGAVVSYAGEREVIPFIQDTGDLEYQLTSLLVQLTSDDKPVIGVIETSAAPESSMSGMETGDIGPPSTMQAFEQELRRQYEVRSLAPSDITKFVPKEIRTLVIAGTGETLDPRSRRSIERYLERGGSALVLAEGVAVDLQTGQATKIEQGLGPLVEPWGVEVQPALVYDLRANTQTSFGGAGGLSYVVPYVYWPRASTSQRHPVSRGLDSVSLPWTSPLLIDDGALDKVGATATPLLRSTTQAGAAQEPFDINPQVQPPTDDLERRLLGVAITPRRSAAGDGAQDKDASGTRAPRLVVVGDADLVSDQFGQVAQAGLPFALQAVSWLSQSPSLAAIKVKGSGDRALVLEEEGTASRIRWGNMLLALLLPVAFGAWRLVRRRRLARHTFRTRPPKGLRPGGEASSSGKVAA